MSNVNRKVIQILRSSKDYDPSTSEEILNDGELLYAKSNNQLYIGDNVNKLKDLNPITSYNLKDNEKGSLNQFSTISQDILFDGENYGLKKGDIISGAKASGYQSVAFGGLRYDYASYHYIKLPVEITGTEGNYKTIYKYYDCEVGSYDEFSPPQIYLTLTSYNADGTKDQSIYSNYGSETIDIPFKYNTDTNQGEQIYTCIIRYATDIDHNPSKGIWKGKSIIIEGDGPFSKPIISTLYGSKTPTSAEGNQSFAAGASVHAHGDFSVAFGKDNDAHQRGGFVTGGGCRVGMTEEEFNAFYWDDVNNIPLNDGKGKNADGKITDFENKSYEQSYSFGFTSGTINKALGRDSFATGLGTQALGRTSFASGMGSKALGSESFAAGSKTYATGDMSAAFGIGVHDSEIGEYGIRGATGKCSFVAGRSANATGDFSQAFGYFTQATGSSSFAAGNHTEATGKASVSLGDGTKAIGDGSVALGYNSQAKGLYSFAMGDENTIVEGNYSSAFGRGLRTSPKNNGGQHIIGRWNDLNYLELMAFAVGAGSDDNNRKNLLSLYNDGRLRLPNITGTLTGNDVTRLKDVENLITEATTEIDRKFEALDSDFFNSIY